MFSPNRCVVVLVRVVVVLVGIGVEGVAVEAAKQYWYQKTVASLGLFLQHIGNRLTLFGLDISIRFGVWAR